MRYYPTWGFEKLIGIRCCRCRLRGLPNGQGWLGQALEPSQMSFNEKIQRARILCDLNRYEQACEELRERLVAEPENLSALLELCWIQIILGQLDEARVIAQTVISLDSDLSFGYQAMSDILRQQGHFEESLVHIDTTLEIDPDRALHHCHRAMLLLKLQRPSEAFDAVMKGLAVEPDDEDCLLFLAGYLFLTWRAGEARAVLQEVLHRYPESQRAFSLLGQIEHSFGNLDRSEDWFLTALCLAPEDGYSQEGLKNVRHQRTVSDHRRPTWPG